MSGTKGGLFLHESSDAADPLKAETDGQKSDETVLPVAAGFHLQASDLMTKIWEKEKENCLNKDCTREKVERLGGVEIIENSERIKLAFEALRRGYPDKPMIEQCQGAEFRENSAKIISEIARQSLRGEDPEKAVVVLPWRAALSFGLEYQKQGVKRFYHVSSRRNEKTLETMVDYEAGEVKNGDTLILGDPMLATGNTDVDAINRILAKGIVPGKIIVNALVAAPVGVMNLRQYPGIRMVMGSLDEKLDCRGYIVPGFGDCGDKWSEGLTVEDVNMIADRLYFDGLSRRKLLNRYGFN
jgi:uracil phosphoribosyltransferase